IKCKIPSLVIPHDYDQFDYAARIEYFDVGIRIKNRKNIEDIVKKINILFERKDWKNLEKLSNDFKKYYPHETLDEEIQRLLSI
ncbi:MAG: glycosyl transferase, partial [Leptotrichiaceae bacterium]